jgi:hypothetical protein
MLGGERWDFRPDAGYDLRQLDEAIAVAVTLA